MEGLKDVINNALYENFTKEIHSFEKDIKKFVDKYPEKSYLLEAIQGKEKDPYVERLFSGVAFLVSRLRSELDETLDSISEAILRQHWPFVFQPYPAIMIVEALSIKAPSGIIVSQGEPLIKTAPIGEEKTECIFSSISDEKLIPLSLTNSHYMLSEEDENAVLTLSFQLSLSSADQKVHLDKIKLYLNDSKYEALLLYGAFSEYLEKIYFYSNEESIEIDVNALNCSLDINSDVFCFLEKSQVRNEYRALLDFFYCIEKFLFVELRGIPPFSGDAFKVKMYFNKKIFNSSQKVIDMTNKIKINCIPVVNFYEKSGEPFEYHHSKESYPVVIDHARLNSIVPICVKSMHKTSNQVAIKCEEISEININLVKNKNSYFVSKSYVDDKLSDLCFQLYSDEKEAEQIISYDAWVYNKNTPAEGISPNAKFLIKKKEESFTLINLQRPSKEKKVFNINRSYETCLEILGMHFSDITNVSAFKKMLMLFVPKDDRKVNKMKYVDSIIDIKISYQDYLKKGMMRNIMIVTFIAHLNHFDNIGEAILWFKVLAKVLSAYVPVNQSVKIMTQVEDEEESWVSFCKL